MKFPVTYWNGHNKIEILENGDKTVTGPLTKGLFPETIDIKVTDYCNAGCKFCHEQSTTQGRHANLESTQRMLSPLPYGVELAIGGGNPMDWPHLEGFLVWASDRFICNITVNGAHIKKHHKRLVDFQQRELLHGIGVSAITHGVWASDFGLPAESYLNNYVGHIIPGLWGPYKTHMILTALGEKSDVFDSIMNRKQYLPHLLVLGYKFYGRGANANREEIEENITYLRRRLPRFLAYLGKRGVTVSFDNLALEQYDVKSIVSQEAWDSFYLGPDGYRSMYINAVEQYSALNSTSDDPISWEEAHPNEAFQELFIANRYW